MKRILIIALSILVPFMGSAQCAMCRSQVSNNVSDGGENLAQALNFGILYLFFTPYVALGVIAFFWFRYSKKHGKISFAKRP